MLSPDARTVAMDMMRPPAGYRLDRAVLTTYSLDLDVLLALPLAVMAQTDRPVRELMDDPLLLLEALREAGQRIDLFVDQTGIAVPHTNRALYAMLETSVHPVRSLNGGAFHPKLWVMRFVDEEGWPLIRVAVASRNLTHDRSWDVALVSEAAPDVAGTERASAPLAGLLEQLPGLALESLDTDTVQAMADLAGEVGRTEFPAPEGFSGSVRFEVLGMESGQSGPWRPEGGGNRLLAMAPFVNRGGLEVLTSASTGERTLISRQEALDDLAANALDEWETVQVLADAAIDEEAAEETDRPSTLHAKLFAIEYGRLVRWYVGSANLTAAALHGRNVEVMACLEGKRGNQGSGRGVGIERFAESGFLKLCQPYQRCERPIDDTLERARGKLERARDALLAGKLAITCQSGESDWQWSLDGSISLPEGVTAVAWPVSINEDQAATLPLPITWSLPMARLTAFVAFRLSVEADVDDLRLVLKLPATGLPEGRVAQVLRTLIDSPERFMQFLRALLGGLEGMADWLGQGDGKGWEGEFIAGLGGETLLEDLLRVAARDPERLEPVRRLIADLRSTPEGREIVRDDLYELWQVVDGAMSRGGQIEES